MSAAAVLDARPGLRVRGDGTLVRSELATPGTCGPNSLFVGRLGDWTWDAVSAACGTNVYDAREPGGAPVYLSFYYFRIRGSRRFNPQRITFGDRLQVASAVFQQTSESVLTLHRVRKERDAADPAPIDAAPTDTASADTAPIDPGEFYAAADEDCLYVENFNRWIARGRPDSNRDLVRSSPVGFEYRHLPALPPRFSPRVACAQARDQLAFEHNTRPLRLPDEPFRVSYRVDASRDLNAVGLLYFASYFSIVDWALLRLWRRLGRGDRAFLRRAVLDQRMCYLGNADADAALEITLTRWPSRTDPHDELVDAVVADGATGRTLAVSSLHVCPGTESAT